MGKGKRMRTMRSQQTAPQKHVDSDYPFLVDKETRAQLGEQGLAVLAANLWPVDCQTCGWQLGSAKPAVSVLDIAVFLSASLHHERCRPPSNSFGGQMPKQRLMSYAVRSFLVPFEVTRTGTTTRVDRPFVIVNPSLEQVNLQSVDGRWEASTSQHFRQLGLRTPGRDFVPDAPVPDINAKLDGDTVKVSFELIPEAWECDASGPIGEAVRDLGGVTLAVTTAVHPHRIATQEQLYAALSSPQVAAGWIPLEGSEQPLDAASAAPESLCTYVLHWSPQHATVGELLATTDDSLTPDAAMNWALKHPEVPGAEYRLPWEQHRDDAAAWFTTDALSLSTFFVRRHADGWHLVKAVARIDGAHGKTAGDIRDWGTRAARLHGSVRVLNWVPAPSTGPEFTTLHGSATSV